MKLSGLLILLAMSSASAQTPPTATETFNLRIRCNEMAVQKLESMTTQPLSVSDGAALGFSPADVEAMNKNMPKLLLSFQKSRFDPIANRCYAELYMHTQNGKIEVMNRQIYDLQVDNLLAFTRIENGKKYGLVFDPRHKVTSDANAGFDDAEEYIVKMMEDR